MTQKVVVTKEVAEALKVSTPSYGWSIGEVIESHLGDDFVSDKRSPLNVSKGKISTDDLMKALVNGYEVEKIITLDTEEFEGKTEEELVETNRRISAQLKDKRGSEIFSYGDGVYDGIMFTLSELGIEVDKEV
ncbi:hypothetical protein ACM5ME_20460 [Bacillus subtilis]|uniref:hypothetical protein n=1 Tax=Bacillus subtilis group TaxID=653685 RepID=UPI0005EFA3C6|nr:MULTISPECIES: hypothetical protein [Bacillus subtilis group]MDE1381174.1 hypothetical protein [Bacillus licheniformis]